MNAQVKADLHFQPLFLQKASISRRFRPITFHGGISLSTGWVIAYTVIAYDRCYKKTFFKRSSNGNFFYTMDPGWVVLWKVLTLAVNIKQKIALFRQLLVYIVIVNTVRYTWDISMPYLLSDRNNENSLFFNDGSEITVLEVWTEFGIDSFSSIIFTYSSSWAQL